MIVTVFAPGEEVPDVVAPDELHAAGASANAATARVVSSSTMRGGPAPVCGRDRVIG